ncbi:MAG: hypothetical protein AB7E46_00005, partial [Desulfovibrio sp.]
EGMHRFTHSKIYPVDFGICGMVGYVMNGNIGKARSTVLSKVSLSYASYTLTDPAQPIPCHGGHHYKTLLASETSHPLCVSHVFLPVSL